LVHLKMAPRGVRFEGIRFVAGFGAFLGAIALTCYPIIIAPYRNPEGWKQISETVRKEANIKQEDIQPGGMKVWSDPYDRPGKPGNK